MIATVVMVRRVVKKLMGSDSPDDTMPAPWVNKTLLQLMASERGWLRRGSLPLGLSLVAIARRVG